MHTKCVLIDNKLCDISRSKHIRSEFRAFNQLSTAVI